MYLVCFVCSVVARTAQSAAGNQAGNPSPWGNGEIFPHAHRSASPFRSSHLADLL